MGRDSDSESYIHTGRRHPALLRAAGTDDVDLLCKVITQARESGYFSNEFLHPGLMRSVERGCVAALEYLLQIGADPNPSSSNKRSLALFCAIHRGNHEIVRLLLDYGASPNVLDEDQRTPLMTAAWKNEAKILQLLISRGANINATDCKRRNVLHNLAADRYCRWDWGKDVLRVLLQNNCEADGKDELGRTPLHWACENNHEEIMELLLNGPDRPLANIHATELRGRTPLHLGATQGWVDILQFLLAKGASVTAVSDGNWTPLPCVCDSGNVAALRALLHHGAPINSLLLNGVTPLHIAAPQAGHLGVVECLLERPELKHNPRNNRGDTPFSRAARSKRKSILHLLAPSNRFNKLSDDQRAACMEFDALWTDFRGNRKETRIQKMSVFGLLYQKDPENPHGQLVSVTPSSEEVSLRWIHLPANNMDWVEALVTKAFIEKGANDVQGTCPVPVMSYLWTSLHPRQTLDQYFYPHANTERRDQDQVVYRYQTSGPGRKISPDKEPRLFMVDRLWMWVLGEDLIVTCFPQRWNPPKADPSNLKYMIIQDICSSNSSRIESVYDLVATITERCLSVFDSQQLEDTEYQFFDMFESSIKLANDREVVFFPISIRHPSRLRTGSTQNSRDVIKGNLNIDEENNSILSQNSPQFVDRMLDIGEETDLLAEVKDIRDELNIIRHLLEHQTQILSRFQHKVKTIKQDSLHTASNDYLANPQLMIELRLQHINRMDRPAERVYHSMVHLLDLKQKQANAFEARFARDQAEGTARQSKILMVFTMVTIVFLPLSFLTSFFAINIREFSDLSLAFVSKWTFRIGFAISIPPILVAISVDNIGYFFSEAADCFFRRGRWTSNDFSVDDTHS
ncbi:unnamed protein product [Penicillium pancosmium]